MRPKNYTPHLIEKLIKEKEITFQKFFNLEEKPEDNKKFSNPNKLIRDFRSKIKDALYQTGDIIKSCDADYLQDAKASASEVDGIVCDMDYDVDELEKIIQQWEHAYQSLEDLILEILNKEKIDLTNYSNNMTESEVKSYNRIKFIDKLLD